LRRGEISALRWKSVDLENGQLAVVASTEQLDSGDKKKRIREKEAKSGRSRTVALPLMATEELRRWRAQQAEELLKLGVGVDESWHVVTQADGSTPQPRSLTHAVSAFLKKWNVTLHKLPCWLPISIPRWSRSGLGTRQLRSQWTFIAT
jgi:integrase